MEKAKKPYFGRIFGFFTKRIIFLKIFLKNYLVNLKTSKFQKNPEPLFYKKCLTNLLTIDLLTKVVSYDPFHLKTGVQDESQNIIKCSKLGRKKIPLNHWDLLFTTFLKKPYTCGKNWNRHFIFEKIRMICFV